MSDLKKSTDALSSEFLGEVDYQEIRAEEQQRSASRRYPLLNAVDALLKAQEHPSQEEHVDERWRVLATGTEKEAAAEKAKGGDDAVLIAPTAANVKHTRRLPDLVFPHRPRKETRT